MDLPKYITIGYAINQVVQFGGREKVVTAEFAEAIKAS